MTAADRDREAFEACQYAERLAASMHAKHYSDNTTWRPLSGDLIGLLTQIDNMAAGLTHARAQAGEPVAWQYRMRMRPADEWGAWTETDAMVSFRPNTDTWQSRPLYAHPAPAQEPVEVPAGMTADEAWQDLCEKDDRTSIDYPGFALIRQDELAGYMAAAPVSPAADRGAWPYQKTFDAIAAATRIEGGHIAVSVKAFGETFGPLASHTPAPQPGGVAMDAEVERDLDATDFALIDAAWEHHRDAVPAARVINDNQPGRTAIIEVLCDPPTLEVGTELYRRPALKFGALPLPTPAGEGS